MIAPPAAAALVSITLPLAVLEPRTVEGLTVIELKLGGLIVRVADSQIDPTAPVMFTSVLSDTGTVITLKVDEDLPAGI